MKNIKRKTIINTSVILLISVGFTFYFAGPDTRFMSIILNILYGLIIGLTIAVGSHLISRRIFSSDKVYQNPTKYFVGAILSVSLYIIVSTTIVNYLWFKITQGATLSELLQSQVGIYTLASELILGLIIYLILLSRYFINDLQHYYNRITDVESQLSKYRYDTLKNQLKPHFLFNSLNTLSGLVHIDSDRADEFIGRLSNLYRYVLDVQEKELVPIEDEISLVQDFMYLNNIRFDNQIVLSIDLENEEGHVVPLALQLLVENAIKHNKVSEKQPLHISIVKMDEWIEVSNQIQLKVEKEPSHHMGINNLKSRYSTLTDKTIQVEESNGTFKVRIPILQKQNV